MPEIIFERLHVPTTELMALVLAGIAEGFRFAGRLMDDWKSGENRFDKVGEGFWVARQGVMVVGMVGLNRDPYVLDGSVGRLRHLYVAQGARQRGIGRQLVEIALDWATRHFSCVRLRTDTASADRFYRGLGFAITNSETATHELFCGSDRHFYLSANPSDSTPDVPSESN